MRDYGKVSPQFWVDEVGNKHRVLASRRLDYSQPGPAQLRAYITKRDGGCCVICGCGADLVIDHEVSLKNGGSNHPDNLRILCGTCNCRKVGLFDATNAANKPHISGVDWMVWADAECLRYGVILGGSSVRFSLPRGRAIQMAEALLELAKRTG